MLTWREDREAFQFTFPYDDKQQAMTIEYREKLIKIYSNFISIHFVG